MKTWNFRIKRKKPAVFAFAAILLAVLAAPSAALAYTPPVTALKIGLSYGAAALTSANLRNVDNFGMGFEFGYFDSNRNFVSVGAVTDVNGISIVKDRNVFFYPAAADAPYSEYREGTSGSIVVGCYHIQLGASFGNYYDALNVSNQYNSSFVKFASGQYFVCTGNYISEEAAYAAMLERGIQGASITSGTATTLTVVQTGTNTILFEFDYDSSYHMGVQPVSTGVKCETWFRGNRYYGGFQFIRNGGEITVVNVVTPDDYVKGVVHHEMGASWPLEALKAQACCARTYGMSYVGYHSSSGFDLCTTDHCQVYGGRNGASENSDRAVDETSGMYITYNGTLCQTYFFSSDGGATENVENVWRDALPYLRGVVDPYEADAVAASKIPNYSWQLTFTPAELTQKMRDRGYNCATIVSMTARYTEVGNVYSVTLKDTNGASWTIEKRDKLNMVLGVPSIRFTVGGGAQPGTSGDVYVNGSSDTISKSMSGYYAIDGGGVSSELPGGNVYAVNGSGGAEIVEGDAGSISGAQGSSNGMVNGVFTLNGTGRGHNVGMSQWGAYSMAQYHNMTFRDIINFYYTGVVIG